MDEHRSEPDRPGIVKTGGATDTAIVDEPSGDRRFVKGSGERIYREDGLWDVARDVVWRVSGALDIPGHARTRPLFDAFADLAAIDWRVVEEPVEGRLVGELIAERDLAALEDLIPAVTGYLARLHLPLDADEGRYRRSIRYGLIELSLRVVDLNDTEWAGLGFDASPIVMAMVEHRFRTRDLDATWRIHGDLHPWNVFVSAQDVRVIGARLPGYGDVCDDVAAFATNFIFSSLVAGPSLSPEWARLIDRFAADYSRAVGSDEWQERIGPFVLKRLLVMGSSFHYASLDADVRLRVLRLAQEMCRLGLERFRLEAATIEGVLAEPGGAR